MIIRIEQEAKEKRTHRSRSFETDPALTQSDDSTVDKI